MSSCSRCNGKGRLWQTVCGHPSYEVSCPDCHGTGKGPEIRGSVCGGTGYLWQTVCGYPSYKVTCNACHGTGSK